MRVIHADLHIHTCLSPCAELEMSPRGIVSEAVSKGADLIAVCDHNSAENAAAVMDASRQTNITVLPGMEVTSKEEVHVLGIFSTPDDATDMQTLIYEHLEGQNDAEVFGMQVVVEADGTVLGYNERLLIGATDLSLERVVQAIHAHNGLAVAAHIDREGFGILGQLGFIPPDLSLDALEISTRMGLSDARSTYSGYSDYTLLQSSDAHVLDAVGSGRTPLTMEAASFDELKLALKGDQGRGVCYKG